MRHQNIVSVLLTTLCIVGCTDSSKPNNLVDDGGMVFVERVDTNGLIVLFPYFSTIDLRCGNMPSITEKDVILFAEASYTGAPLEREFKHSKIAGDHVSGGIRYKGYRCSRYTGAFVYHCTNWITFYK